MTYYFAIPEDKVKKFLCRNNIPGNDNGKFVTVDFIAYNDIHGSMDRGMYPAEKIGYYYRNNNNEKFMVYKIDLIDCWCISEFVPITFREWTHKIDNAKCGETMSVFLYDGYLKLMDALSLSKLDYSIEEPYHHYYFAVDLKEKLILTNGSEDRVKSIRIRDILNDARKTVELPVFNGGLMCRPDGTIYYVYSVRLPDKYIESFFIGKESFVKALYLSNNTIVGPVVTVVMYHSINGPKGLKDSMGLEERRASLKNFWQPAAKPWDFITTKPECNITIDIPKDFTLRPYVKAEPSTMYGFMEDMRKMSMFESDRKVRIPEIKEVIFNKPATVVYWKDGTKTVVKCGNDEPYDREKAVAMCFLKKMLKPSEKSHWLDVIHDAIKVAEEKENRKAEARDAKIIKKATDKAKAEQAKKKTAELKAAIQKLETKSLEEMNSKVEGKDEFEEKYKDVPVKPSKNEVSKEYVEKIFDQAAKENKKWAQQANDNKGKKNKIDLDVLVDCIKEDLTIDEIAEMNSWDKAAVARLYYKMTGTRPKKKDNTYSELDNLFEQGVSVDAAARRTGFSKNIVAMRYAKLQGRKDKK